MPNPIVNRRVVLRRTGVSYDADAQTYFTATGITDATQKGAVNQLVVELKAASLWTKMAALYPFVGGAATPHSYNLKNPAAFQITWVNASTHDANGVAGDGSTSYGDLNLSPVSALSLTSHHLSIYTRSTSIADGFEIGSADGANQWLILGCRHNGNQDSIDVILSNRTIVANTNGGHFILSQDGGAHHETYNNGVSTGTGTEDVSAGTLPTPNLYICGWNNNGALANPNSKNIALASAGDGLSDAEAASFTAIVQTFQTALGRNV